MDTVNIENLNLSEEQLQEMLKKKQKERKENELRKRAGYEEERDRLVTELVNGAKQLNAMMVAYKTMVVNKLEEFRTKAVEYGEIRSNSKGGYRLRNAAKTMMVEYERNTKSEYDERASMAEELLKEFLEEKVKKKDLQTYRTITALLSRNKKGDYTPSQINRLLAIEDNYDDERWGKAMKLFKESFASILVSMSVSFYEKDTFDKDKLIPLSFTGLEVDNQSSDNTQEKA